mmetsp:Transcript_17527/g.53900  ORF Transcript_17527/g.53900 Transcript_17527/m.53900 type:complete len:227 (-) Transcript_17527:75-755(-)
MTRLMATRLGTLAAIFMLDGVVAEADVLQRVDVASDAACEIVATLALDSKPFVLDTTRVLDSPDGRRKLPLEGPCPYCLRCVRNPGVARRATNAAPRSSADGSRHRRGRRAAIPRGRVLSRSGPSRRPLREAGRRPCESAQVPRDASVDKGHRKLPMEGPCPFCFTCEKLVAKLRAKTDDGEEDTTDGGLASSPLGRRLGIGVSILPAVVLRVGDVDYECSPLKDA